MIEPIISSSHRLQTVNFSGPGAALLPVDTGGGDRTLTSAIRV